MATPQLPPKQTKSTPVVSYKLPAITIPSYLESLPIKNLKELASNHELLRNYVLDSNGTEIKDNSALLLTQIESNILILNDLLAQLDNEIVPRQALLNEKLSQLNDKFTRVWSQHELEMYLLLNKYSTENLIKSMGALVLEANDVSQSLYNSLLSNDKLTDSQVSKFLEEYQDSRRLYYMRKEKLYRLKENRVSR